MAVGALACLVVALAWVLEAGAQSPAPPGLPPVGQPSDNAAIDRTEYIVGPNDILTIGVWNQPALSGKFSVEADGIFAFPLVGRIQAGGLTLQAIEDSLRTRLAAGYLKQPQVSVAIEQYRSQRVFILGEVRQPGPYTLTGGDTSLIEALARAGSTTAEAGGAAVIVRASPGRQSSGPVLPEQVDESQVTRIDLQQLHEGAAALNILLHDGDTVFVPRGEKAYVFGHVRNPGAFTIDQHTTVLQALSLAGGVTERGATGRIKIVRVMDGKKVEIKAKLNDRILSGDTVVVPERFF